MNSVLARYGYHLKRVCMLDIHDLKVLKIGTNVCNLYSNKLPFERTHNTLPMNESLESLNRFTVHRL